MNGSPMDLNEACVTMQDACSTIRLAWGDEGALAFGYHCATLFWWPEAARRPMLPTMGGPDAPALLLWMESSMSDILMPRRYRLKINKRVRLHIRAATWDPFTRLGHIFPAVSESAKRMQGRFFANIWTKTANECLEQGISDHFTVMATAGWNAVCRPTD